MSVAPRAPASRATSAATRFSLSMLATAPWSTARLAALSFAAVVITPVPSGFDRKSRSPDRRPPLMRMRSAWTRPVTQRPYLGSASTTVCPPRDHAARLRDLVTASPEHLRDDRL